MLSQRGTKAFITSWLRFCNSLFADLPATSLRHLQLTLNFTVETWISEHFDSLLRELLWFHLGKVVASGWNEFSIYQFSISPFHFLSFSFPVTWFAVSPLVMMTTFSSWVAFHLLLSVSVLLVNIQKTAKALYCVEASQWLSALTY